MGNAIDNKVSQGPARMKAHTAWKTWEAWNCFDSLLEKVSYGS